MLYPKHFIENVENTWGESGKQWLLSLPSLIEHFEQKWQLTAPQMSSNLSFNMVIFAQQAYKADNSVQKNKVDKVNKVDKIDRNVVLKICPYIKGFAHEIAVLKFYNGIGVVQLLDYDLEKSAMLLARISPGTTLKKLFPDNDQKATAIAVSVMKKLHSVNLDTRVINFPKVEDWLQTLQNDFSEIPAKLMDKARTLSINLLHTQQKLVLLHGDLHHDNILFNGIHGPDLQINGSDLHNENDWISIDPKGVIGEPAYEVGAFIRNPIPEIFNNRNAQEIIFKRIEHFSKLLKVERKRLLDWCFVQTILSACWAIEDNSTIWKPLLELAQLMDIE